MAADAIAPPEGFVLDAPAGGPAPPPEGFVLDQSPSVAKPQPSLSQAVTDIPGEIGRTAAANWQAFRQGVPESLGGTRDVTQEGFFEGLGKTGKAAMALPGMAFSPITGAARSLLGHPLAQAEHAAGMLINPQVAAKDDPNEMYKQAADAVDTALMGLMPGRRGAPVPLPRAPEAGPLGVTLSEGQATGELPKIQMEQAARRNLLGAPAQARAGEFFDVQQPAQLEAAQEHVARSLDPFGQIVTESPAGAGELAAQSLTQAAGSTKAGVRAAYDYAASLPAQVHAGALEGIGQRIKGDLFAAAEPVIVDAKTTPQAAHMLDDIDRGISRMAIENKADPFGPPGQENITGVSLKGLDQARKRLVIFARDARNSGNAADARAAGRIIDAFDDHIEGAIDAGKFTGDPRAVEAWKDARAANADYRKTFSAAKNDPVGRVVEKVLGKGPLGPATGNDVADFLYGSSGVNPSTLNRQVAARLKSVLGEQSPEWSAVKQGLFARLVEPGGELTGFGHQKVAQRIEKFLNVDGREMAQEVFSPQDRHLIRQYGQLRRQLVVPQAGANWSNTSTFQKVALGAVEHFMGGILGASLGSTMGHPWIGYMMGSTAGVKTGNWLVGLKNRVIYKDLPLVSEQMKAYQKALAKAQRQNSGPNQAALAIASNNVARTLQQLGGNAGNALRQLQAPGAGKTEDQQRNGPGLPGQQKHGGGVTEKEGFRHGGTVAEFDDGGQVEPDESLMQRWQNYREKMERGEVTPGTLPWRQTPTPTPVDKQLQAAGKAGAAGALGTGMTMGLTGTAITGPESFVPAFATGAVLGGVPGAILGWNHPDIFETGQKLKRKRGGKVDESYSEWRERIGWANGGRVMPQNIHPNPTEAQKEAGNYAKDHVRVHGLNITVENAKGSYRGGVDKGGKPWRVKMPAHYGYIKGTVGKDKDHVDVYLGPSLKSPKVFVVDQLNADTGKFDEHKCFIGFGSKGQVTSTYHKAFSDGRAGERLGHIAETTIDRFKAWLEHGDTTKPVGGSRKDRVRAIIEREMRA